MEYQVITHSQVYPPTANTSFNLKTVGLSLFSRHHDTYRRMVRVGKGEYDDDHERKWFSTPHQAVLAYRARILDDPEGMSLSRELESKLADADTRTDDQHLEIPE